MPRLTWLKSSDETRMALAALAPLRTAWESELIGRETATGICSVCGHIGAFRVTAGEPEGHWRNLLEGMICECGLNGRMRLIWNAFVDTAEARPLAKSHIFERLTPLFLRIAEQGPLRDLTSSEFLGNELVGGANHIVQGISLRHESMLDLSFPDASMDFLMHFDVLEHVPDHRLALRECRRVLKDTGAMLFSIPFYPGLEKHLVRALRTPDGDIHHLLPEAYHGNPVDPHGALVFIHPGWELLMDLSEAGFSRVEIGLGYDAAGLIVSNGCPYDDGHAWPIVFRACP